MRPLGERFSQLCSMRANILENFDQSKRASQVCGYRLPLESMVVPFLWSVWSMVISLGHFGARIVVYGFAMFWYTWTFYMIYWCLCCVHFVVLVVVIVHWKKGTPNCTKTQPPHHAMAPLLAACSAHLCPVSFHALLSSGSKVLRIKSFQVN